MTQTVLLVLADDELSRSIEHALQGVGYDICIAPDRYKAVALMNERNPDFIVLDRSIPDSEVVLLCRSIRWEMKLPATSILLLSDTPHPSDRFMDIRVDDFLVKPVEVDEVVEKLASMKVRLSAGKSKPVLKSGDIEMLREQWTVYVGGGPVNLTEKEYRLLQELLEANGRVLTRDTLLERVWGPQSANIESRTLDVHMSRLRRKLGRSARNIVTVRNVGYRISVFPE
jgi:DNA-binding response OmpR family regulator